MQRATFEGHFYETYYFANMVRNVLHDQFVYLPLLEDFFNAGEYSEYVQPFSKYSVFHKFIEYLITWLINEETFGIQLDIRQDTMDRFKNVPQALDELRPTDLPIENAFSYYCIDYTSFVEWLQARNKDFLGANDDDVSDYYDELFLEGPFEILIDRVVQETFFILFQNRGLLLLFNEMMASRVANGDFSGENDPLFTKSGVLRRVHIPRWVKRAVFFRDRGLCVICQRDLSGIVNISNSEHFDHIVSLAKGGLNDVSNMQLLCQNCNLGKRDKEARTSNLYEAWYPMGD